MKLLARVARVAQIGELTELRLVAIGNHVASFERGQDVEVTATAVPAERPACTHGRPSKRPCDGCMFKMKLGPATPPDTGERGK